MIVEHATNIDDVQISCDCCACGNVEKFVVTREQLRARTSGASLCAAFRSLSFDQIETIRTSVCKRCRKTFYL